MADLLIAIQALWIGLVVAANLRKLTRPKYRLPKTIPDFRLFAPMPLDRQYLVFFRGFHQRDEASGWTPMAGLSPPPTSFLRRRNVKLVIDCVDQLLQHYDRKGTASGSEAHQLFLNLSSAHQPDARFVQFAVASIARKPDVNSVQVAGGDGQVEVVYASDVLERVDPGTWGRT